MFPFSRLRRGVEREAQLREEAGCEVRADNSSCYCYGCGVADFGVFIYWTNTGGSWVWSVKDFVVLFSLDLIVNLFEQGLWDWILLLCDGVLPKISPHNRGSILKHFWALLKSCPLAAFRPKLNKYIICGRHKRAPHTPPKCKTVFISVLLSALKLVSLVNNQLNRWEGAETKGKHYLAKMVSACYLERQFKWRQS